MSSRLPTMKITMRCLREFVIFPALTATLCYGAALVRASIDATGTRHNGLFAFSGINASMRARMTLGRSSGNQSTYRRPANNCLVIICARSTGK